MKLKVNRIISIAVFFVVLALFVWMIVQCASYAAQPDSISRSTVLLDGEYSIDGGEWQNIDNDTPIDKPFKKAVFKGKFIEGSIIVTRYTSSAKIYGTP